jgi:SAM-dependent methyltransferase
VWAGLEAIHTIEQGLAAAGESEPGIILDLPSGYGRALRFLRVAYPEAEIVACDLNRDAVRFCARRFGAKPRDSTPDLDRLSFPQRFDLIWCGSLLTHLSESDASSLIALMRRSLAPRGVAVVTTHGEHLAPKPDGTWNGGLTPEAVARLRSSVDRTGFGWEPYGGGGRYGAAVMSREWLRDRAGQLALTEVWFEQDGWGGYQDAFALAAGRA